mgnify:CR=1 FL=1
MRGLFIRSLAVSLAVGFFILLAAQGQQPDYEAEIKRIRQELMRVQEERERTAAEKEKDAKEFAEYRKRALKTIKEINSQTDSIRQLVLVHSAKNDSLAAVLDREKARIRGFELTQDQTRRDLAAAAERILTAASLLPPGASSRFTAAINLLKNELAAKSVDNIEAINRLSQIIRDMHEAGAGIQIVQGNSPVAEIRGTAYRIRIGAVYEAVVNAAGTMAAIWTGRDANGNDTWKVVSDPEIAAGILKAVNVREGKSLPQLVYLPFEQTLLAKSAEAGNEK